MKIVLMTLVFLVMGALCPLSGLFGADSLQINESLSSVNISEKVYYIEDRDKKLSLEDIIGAGEHQWKKSEKKYINFGYTQSQYWFRFSIMNSARRTLTWILEIDFPSIDIIELFVPDGRGGFSSRKTGDLLPFESREIEHINYLYKISQKPGVMTFFMRVNSEDSINFNLNVLSYSGMLKRLYQELPTYWIFFGLMLIMFIYNMILFMTMREASYLYLSGFIAAYSLFEFNFKGFASQYLWPNASWWTSHANAFLVCMTNLFVTLFMIDFVGIRFRGLNRIAVVERITTFLVGVFLLLTGVASVLTLILSVRRGLMLTYIITAVNIVGQVSIGIYLAFIRRPPVRQARIALMGFSLLALMTPVVIFTMLGVLPANFFTRWAIQLGASFAIVFLSYGMAEKIISMKKAIRVGENRYRHLVESTDEIIFTLADDNSIQSVNGAVRRHLGYSSADLLKMNFLDLIEEPRRAKTMYAQQMVMDYIGDLKTRRKRSARFRVSLRNKYSHEPKELTVTLEYTGDRDVGYALIGKASAVVDDALSEFLETERYTYNLNNYLNNAELMSQRLVRNLYKFIDPADIAEIRIALREAIVNAIEHGNLKLTFQEKTDSMLDSRYFDLIRERQTDPELKRKRVTVDYSLNGVRALYRITDEGEGFDYHMLYGEDPGSEINVSLAHGRGMMMIQGAFDEIKFNRKGNQILLVKYFNK
ncbi:MAG: ATP-binding protein [Spirochaetes bacterium]|nr:ATP-binding protein [Spirochaetota bacterium]